MKSLTVRQPWAWAIARGHKTIENRGWSTPHRGPLAIHAALSWDGDPTGALRTVRDTTRVAGRQLPACLDDDAPYGDVGLVLAVVDVTDVCTASRQHPTVVCDCGPWARPMSVHWQLTNARALREPFPATGRLGLWNCEVPRA